MLLAKTLLNQYILKLFLATKKGQKRDKKSLPMLGFEPDYPDSQARG
jgi:hypothetical protein